MGVGVCIVDADGQAYQVHQGGHIGGKYFDSADATYWWSNTVNNPALKSARALDPNGMPARSIPLQNAPGGKTFAFPADALYVVLE